MSTGDTDQLHDKYLRLLGIPFIALTSILILMFFYFPDNWSLFWRYILSTLLFILLTWEICRWIILQVRKQLPGLANTRKRVLRTMLYTFLVTGTANALLKAMLYFWFGMRPPSMEHVPFFRSLLVNLTADLFFLLLICVVYEILYFFQRYKIALQKAEHLKTQQAQQKLDALKSRVNPHFLFNSLTTLSALIGEDAPRAERFVDQLSTVYRYLLRAGRQPIVSLSDELQFADSYAFLLKNRFEEGAFSLRIQSAGNQNPSHEFEQTLPVLTFQNLLDYLVRTQNVPLHMEIEIQEEQLKVVCKHGPKILSIENTDNDWRQLESNGARQEIQSGSLTLYIPVHPNIP